VGGHRVIGHQIVADQHADVEAHRPIEREFGSITRTARPVTMIDPACRSPWHRVSAFAVKARFMCWTSIFSASARRSATRVELRRGVAVHLGVKIGIGEDQVSVMSHSSTLPANSAISAFLSPAGSMDKIRTAKRGARTEPAHHLRQSRDLAPFHGLAAQDDMGAQAFHDDQRLILVEMQYLRGPLPGSTASCRISAWYSKEGALERQRPAVTDKAHIGQRLLDDHRSRAALDDEDEVEVAVAHLGHVPKLRRAADGRGDGRQPGQPCRQGLGAQGFVGGQCSFPLGLRAGSPVPSPRWHRRAG
jgi:hypothetical protein